MRDQAAAVHALRVSTAARLFSAKDCSVSHTTWMPSWMPGSTAELQPCARPCADVLESLTDKDTHVISLGHSLNCTAARTSALLVDRSLLLSQHVD
jgi:hypothetical protein